MSADPLGRLQALLSRLPGIGKKSATRMIWYILEKDRAFAEALAREIAGLHDAMRRCSVCGNYTESDPCPICSSESRDRSLLCVVERAQDIRIVEESREFHGLYHVLGGLIAPLEGVSPGDLNTESLDRRLRQGGVREVIIALNPTVEGDTTALWLRQWLNDSGVEVSRLATGIPVGGDLEYADPFSLGRSLRGRVKMESRQV